MKNLILGLVILLSANLANAQTFKNAAIDVTCTSDTNSKVIQIISNWNGTDIFINDTLALSEDEQLVVSDHGANPYIQVVGIGINITLFGGDLQTAYEESIKIENGRSQAYVNAYSTNEYFNAICTGTFQVK